ncbi:diguanylate cyclase [Marinomonas sp.]
MMKRPKRFYHSLRWQMNLGLLLLTMGVVLVSVISYNQIKSFEKSAQLQAANYIPTLKTFTHIELTITRLSELSSNMRKSETNAETRVVMDGAQVLIEDLTFNLKMLEQTPQVLQLQRVLQRLSPNIKRLSEKQIAYHNLERHFKSKVEKAIHYSASIFSSQKDMMKVEEWRQLVLSFVSLSNSGRQYEMRRVLSQIQQLVEILEESPLSANRGAALVFGKLLHAQDGIMPLSKSLAALRAEVTGIDTQNKILVGNIVDYSQRIYQEIQDHVSAQAEDLVVTTSQTKQQLYVILVLETLFFVAIYVFCRRHLFARLTMLTDLVSTSEHVIEDKLKSFDQRNEIGSLVYQLRDYLITISRQQTQLTQVSQQMQAVVSHSKSGIAVFKGDNILFCNDALEDIFLNVGLKNVADLPVVLQVLAKPVAIEVDTKDGSMTLVKAYYDVPSERWFDVIGVNIFWGDNDALLVTFIDVTDREQAAQEYLEILSEVETKVKKDALTGLYNRNKFDQEMIDMEGKEFAILLFDIDHFKGYNDTLGHLQGDVALKAVANVISSTVRKSDTAIRYGGEEFVVILDSSDKDIALSKATEILENVRELHEPHPISEHSYVTVSGGIVLSNEIANGTPLECFKLADNRLYEAKASGRNCLAM